jgi:hypothetical protein
MSASATSSSRATLSAIAASVKAVSVGESETARNISDVALCWSSASSRSRVSSAIFLFRPALTEPRPRVTYSALRRLKVLWRCVLTALLPVLPRRLIASPEPQDRGIVAVQTCTGKGPLMSALGQRQTYAVQKGMSALHPIATAKTDFRTRSCLL